MSSDETVESNDEVEFNERLARLQREFPGKVKVLNKGSQLYHFSRDKEGLLTSESFDPSKTFRGFFFFTDRPALGSNVVVDLSRNLIIAVADDNFSEEDRRKLTAIAGDTWEGAMAVGFDGSINRNSHSMLARDNNNEKLAEIIIFPRALDVLSGNIHSYEKSSE